MDLLTYISDPARKQRLAALTKKSEGYLWQVATGWRGKRASAELAIAIETASDVIGPEQVPRGLIRPDLWPLDALAAKEPTGPARERLDPCLEDERGQVARPTGHIEVVDGREAKAREIESLHAEHRAAGGGRYA